METIYQLVEEVCSRDFPILALLPEKQQQKFIMTILLEADTQQMHLFIK